MSEETKALLRGKRTKSPRAQRRDMLDALIDAAIARKSGALATAHDLGGDLERAEAVG
jgi:hypothetical protein